MTHIFHSIVRRLRPAGGFTLVELVVVSLIVSLVGASILGIYMGLVRSWADTSNRIVNQDDARTAVNEISRYLRMAGSSDSNLTDDSDAIALAGAQEIVFYADIDNDDEHLMDKVRYYLSGTTLRMASLAPDTSTSPPTYSTSYSSDGIIVMDGVRNGSNKIFTYYQLNPAYETNPIPANDTLVVMSNPSTDAARQKIVAVRITLSINEGPTLSKGNVELDTLVQIRQRYNGGLNGN